jgi:nucleoside-diphosphate-sugar epimerase
MPFHVIVGAGPTGVATARLLADAGDRVRLITRSGGGPEHPGIELVGADATDSERLTELTRGASTLFNCAMPLYYRWPTDFPPINRSLLTAAERTGAGYVLLGNLYGYGPVDTPITEDLPIAPTTVKGRVRAQMWDEALAAHLAGKVRVTEVRASDYVGPGAYSIFTLTVAPQVLAGEPAVVPADLDAPHTWTYTGDVARALVAVSQDDRAWGHAWHAPSNPPVSVRLLAQQFAQIAGAPNPTLVPMSADDLHAAGATDPVIAEFPEMQYMFQNPLSMDSSRTQATFGLEPTPFEESLAVMAGAFASA